MPNNPQNTVIKVGCKVNLTLKLTGILPNGYHSLDSVFIPVSEPHDTMDIRMLCRDGKGLRLHFDKGYINLTKNTVTKAYAAFCDATGIAPDIYVAIKKGIPSGAGLGGGSADAGYFLSYLAETFAPKLSADELQKIAVSVGADVPFFIRYRRELSPCRATGVGEILQPLPEMREYLGESVLLICCPGFGVSTPWAYAEWDKKHSTNSNDNKKFEKFSSPPLTLPANENIRSESCAEQVRNSSFPLRWDNDFEEVVFPAYPQLARLKQYLLQAGAYDAVMSGSGSSVVGLFHPSVEAKIPEMRALLATEGVTVYVARVL